MNNRQPNYSLIEEEERYKGVKTFSKPTLRLIRVMTYSKCKEHNKYFTKSHVETCLNIKTKIE